MPEGSSTRQARLTFEDLAPRYIKWCQTHNRPSTVTWKRHVFRALVERWWQLQPSDLTREAVDVWQAELTEGRTPATVNRYLAVLRHFYKWCADRRIVTFEKAAEIRGVSLLREAPVRVRYLQKAELDALLAACKHGPLRHVVLLAIHTGLRQGEILGLDWADIDWAESHVHIRDGKGGKPRWVPLNYYAVRALAAMAPGEEAPARGPIWPWVTTWGLVSAWRRARARAGLEDFRFHDLRHHFATSLRNAGVPLHVIRDLLGHAHGTGMQCVLRYAHIGDDSLRDAVNKLKG